MQFYISCRSFKFIMKIQSAEIFFLVSEMALVTLSPEDVEATRILEVVEKDKDPFKVLDLDPIRSTCEDAKRRRDELQKILFTSAGLRSATVTKARELVDQAYAELATPPALHQHRSRHITARSLAAGMNDRMKAIADRTAFLESRAKALLASTPAAGESDSAAAPQDSG
jgi:hypothetical protein